MKTLQDATKSKTRVQQCGVLKLHKEKGKRYFMNSNNFGVNAEVSPASIAVKNIYDNQTESSA